MGAIDLDLQGHFAILPQNFKKRHSISLVFTDLGQPKGAAHLNVLLYLNHSKSFYYVYHSRVTLRNHFHNHWVQNETVDID